MYTTHQPKIAKFARQNPDNLARTKVFVLTSIQKLFYTCNNQMSEIDANGIKATSLNGSKRRSYKEIMATKEYMFDKVFSKKISLAEKLLEVSSIYGIGTVKAGFVLQLCLGNVGCLDVHNLRRYGLSPSAFKVNDKMSEATALAKANLYIKTCEDLGGSKYLWDTWCNYVSDLYPLTFPTGNDVSRFHVECIIK
jgi:hypothetical protein